MAIYYWRGLTNSNWGTAGNWSTGSTSTLGGAVPTNVDDAIFDINSSACTVNVTTAQTRSINFTTYTQTITMTNIMMKVKILCSITITKIEVTVNKIIINKIGMIRELRN
jgi:hypothetical protein